MRWAILIGVMFALIIIPFLIFERQFEALGTWLAEGHASGWASAATIGGLLALDVFLPCLPASFPLALASCLASGVARLSSGWG